MPESLRELMRDRPAPRDLRGPAAAVSGTDWVARLPRLLDEALARWELRLADGPQASRHGQCALVVPVTRAGRPAMLKLTWPHAEAVHEHLALRLWDGRGAVRLLAADPASATLLLERLDPERDLGEEPIEDACATIGTLLRELDRPAPPQLDRLSAQTARWLEAVGANPPRGLPRRFVEQARSLATDLVADPARTDARLVHTDLHFENVLAAGPERSAGEWLAIDPKPLAAEPAYAVWPALHNRWDELGTDPRWGTYQRLGWICDAAGIDEDRARAWALVRTVQASMEDLDDDPRADLTERVTLLKALQPGS